MARRLALLALVGATVAGCSKSRSEPPPTTCGTHAPAVTATATPASVAPGTLVHLVATSTDADDACLGAPEARSYRWRVEARPPASTATLSDPLSAAPTLTADVPGAYQLEVVATDAAGHDSAPVFVTIGATTCSLVAPTASLAGPVSATTFGAVTLPAPTVVDPNCLSSGAPSYAWTLVSRPVGSAAVLSDPAAQRPTLVPDEVGAYQLSLVVTSSAGIASAPAFLVVDAAPCGAAAPALPALVASPAAPDVGTLVTLGLAGPIANPNASACGAAVQPYAYRWVLLSRPAGSTAALASESSAAPAFVADVPGGEYQVALTVTDALGNASAPAYLQVRATTCGANPPVASIQPAAPAGNANSPIALTLTATDADNAAACSGFSATIPAVTWSVVGQPAGSHPALASALTAPTSNGLSPPAFTAANALRADVPGTYLVRAVATASNGVEGAPVLVPVVVAACGAHAPAITSLTVTDGGGVTSRPAVGSAVTVSATISDPDASTATCAAGDVPAMSGASFVWTLTSAPAGSTVPVSAGPQPSAAVTFTPNVAGTYVWKVVATDPQGLASEPASVTVPTGPCGPTVAGTPIVATAPASAGGAVTLALGGAVSSTCVAGGAAPRPTWSLTSRPPGSGAALSDPLAASPTFVADVPGTYGVQLVVTDAGGFSTVYAAAVPVGGCTVPVIVSGGSQPLAATDLLTVTEPDGSPGAAAAPNPGARVSLALPAATASRGGLVAGTCGLGGTEWSIVSRPPGSQAQLSSTTGPAPAFVPDVPGGTWQLAVLARDPQGNASAPYFFTVTTTACGALPPTFPARSPIAFAAAPRANLAFSATAPAAADGNAACPARFAAPVVSYTFSVVSTPAGATAQVTQDGSAAASVLASQGGTYDVQVVARGATGLISAPLVSQVTVSGCGAYPPVASAFSLSQPVPATAGGVTSVSDAPATGASASAGGAAASAVTFYVGVPITAGASVADADAGLGCAGFGVGPQPVRYAWSLVAAPAGSRAALGFPAGPDAVFTPNVPGVYTLSLATADSTGSASTSTVTLSALCGASPPAVAAISAAQAGLVSTPGAPVPLAVGAPVALGAVGVDPDTTAAAACPVAEAQPLAYQWSFVQLPPGSQAVLAGATTASPSFVPDVATDATGTSVPYRLALTVTDPQGHAATARLDVTVTCDAAPPAVATVPGTSTPDFTVSQQLSGITVGGGPGRSVRLTRTSAGARTAAVDGGPAVPTSALFYPGVPLQVSANVPTVQTSPPGCGVYPQTLGYAWTLWRVPSGSAAVLSGASGPAPSFTPDLPGAYELSLVLTDALGRTSRTVLALDVGGAEVASVGACGASAPAAVARAIGPVPAPASAAAVEPIGQRVLLDGSGSLSPDATPFAVDGSGGCGLPVTLRYAWSLQAAPPGSTAVLDGAALVDPTLLPDLPGAYTVRLEVSDGARVAATAIPVTVANLSTPAATGAVFTAATLDGAGRPVVAWWDNQSGAVGAARCTAGCTGPTPTWTSLGSVDTGLGTLTFAAGDEPRPVAVAVSGATTYVAYFTGPGAAATTGARGMRTCAVALAVHDGTSWVRWTPVATIWDGAAPFTACTAGGAPPYGYFEFGRWVSLAMNGAVPAVAFWSVVNAWQTELEVSTCTGADCSAFATGAPIDGTGGRVGRWASLAADGAGALHAAYYVDDDGAGRKGLRYATNASGVFVHTDVDVSPSADAGRFASLAEIPADPPAGPPGPAGLVVAYADVTSHVAKVARCTRAGTTCSFSAPVVVADAASADTGLGAAIAVDPSTGSLRVAYLDAVNGLVRLRASPDGSAFSTLATPPVSRAANAPVGISVTAGSGTGLAWSRSGSGSIGFLTLP